MSNKRPKKGNPKLSLLKQLKAYESAFKAAKRAPNIDLKKVNRIRKAIREGRYQIDFEKLAEKLLKDI